MGIIETVREKYEGWSEVVKLFDDSVVELLGLTPAECRFLAAVIATGTVAGPNNDQATFTVDWNEVARASKMTLANTLLVRDALNTEPKQILIGEDKVLLYPLFRRLRSLTPDEDYSRKPGDRPLETIV